MKAQLIALIVLATLGVGSMAKAQDCKAIADQMERLSCYDSAAKKQTKTAPKQQSQKSNPASPLQAVALSYLKETLVDPGSLRDVEFGAPRSGITRRTDLSPAGVRGLALPIAYNAKNRMGGYAGKQRQFVFISGNKVLFQFEESTLYQSWGPVQLDP